MIASAGEVGLLYYLGLLLIIPSSKLYDPKFIQRSVREIEITATKRERCDKPSNANRSIEYVLQVLVAYLPSCMQLQKT